MGITLNPKRFLKTWDKSYKKRFEMGQQAAIILINSSSDHSASVKHILLPTEIIIRSSVISLSDKDIHKNEG